MVEIGHICPADAKGNQWKVVVPDKKGAAFEFKSQSGELAVEVALLCVELMKWRALVATPVKPASSNRSSGVMA